MQRSLFSFFSHKSCSSSTELTIMRSSWVVCNSASNWVSEIGMGSREMCWDIEVAPENSPGGAAETGRGGDVHGNSKRSSFPLGGCQSAGANRNTNFTSITIHICLSPLLPQVLPLLRNSPS
ncbi:uncharacterized protein LOC124672471 [Lolium rigidum]|uniref:uncharacterized protein LOC124669594 n=1 Tax=Lolium rigidum TaxID=89674 RepID=UPI001F5DB350|nr:uncharacterized protein LOC124669594 [Lolium rigidum]XP_047064652.1 uncharacterized protein LOC124672471 [Lolium rigidum]